MLGAEAGKQRLTKIVPTVMVALLLFIGLVAVLERGPPAVLVYSGASPYNTGSLGTSKLYGIVSDRYENTFVVGDWGRFLSSPIECEGAVVVIISPEYPYTSSEAQAIGDFLARCSSPGIVVADESGNSNAVLSAIGVGVGIEGGSRILDPDTLLPYPEALFSSQWFSGEVVLDIPASLSLGFSGYDVVGVVPRGVIVYNGSGNAVSRSDIPIAVTGSVGDIRFLIVGDGSIFLNQAFDSGAWRLIAGFIDDVCSDRECMVIFDGSKFEALDPLSYLDNPELADPTAILTPTFLASLITRLVHPATWLPPAVAWVNDYVSQILNVDQAVIVIATIISALILGSIIMSRSPVSVRDTRIEDVVERDPIALESLMRSIVKREFKADKSDFRRFYDMLNQLFSSVVGVGLNDPRLKDIFVSRGVEGEKAERFISRMNKLYRRSMRRIGLPLIVNWSKELVKLSQEAIDIFEALGAKRI